MERGRDGREGREGEGKKGKGREGKQGEARARRKPYQVLRTVQYRTVSLRRTWDSPKLIHVIFTHDTPIA